MFSFFKRKTPADTTPAEPVAEAPSAPAPERSWREKLGFGAPPAPEETRPTPAEPTPAERRTWLAKLHSGLRKTGSSIAQVFTGTQIDDALYEELEAALLMADAGVKATEFLLDDLKRRVKEARVTEPAAV